MSVQRDESGRRKVAAEVEVPGTPEEVWRAIATGPGISSWFVPAEVEERVGGEITLSFGPGMDSVSKITAWDPPRRLEADSQDLGPDAPSVASEWIVEARSGGTCIVRVVHSLFTDADDWDGELEAWEAGWPDFFRILRLYLAHHAGEPCALLPLSAMTALSPPEAWAKVAGSLGLSEVAEGEEHRVEAEGLPAFEVKIERTGGGSPHAEELLMRTGEPMTGLAHAFTLKMGEATNVTVRFYLYGDGAEATALKVEPAWRAWMDRLFPQAT